MLNERKDLEVEFNELPEETDETPKKQIVKKYHHISYPVVFITIFNFNLII